MQNKKDETARKMSDEQINEAFESYIQDGDLPFGLTNKKLQERANYEVKNGKLYITMTRHQPAGGVTYHKGLGMSAYHEGEEIYVYDPKNNDLQLHCKKEKHLEADFESWAEEICDGDSVSVEMVGSGKFRVSLPTDNESKIVHNYKEAAAFVSACVEAWNYDAYLEHESHEEIDGTGECNLRDACVKTMLNKLESEWHAQQTPKPIPKKKG
jgi:hypothetical protein